MQPRLSKPGQVYTHTYYAQGGVRSILHSVCSFLLLLSPIPVSSCYRSSTDITTQSQGIPVMPGISVDVWQVCGSARCARRLKFNFRSSFLLPLSTGNVNPYTRHSQAIQFTRKFQTRLTTLFKLKLNTIGQIMGSKMEGLTSLSLSPWVYTECKFYQPKEKNSLTLNLLALLTCKVRCNISITASSFLTIVPPQSIQFRIALVKKS